MLLKSVICYLLYQENNYALAIAKHGNQHITLSWGKVFKYTNVAYILTKLININLWKLHKCAAFFWIQERKQVCFPNHPEFLSENICRVLFFFFHEIQSICICYITSSIKKRHLFLEGWRKGEQSSHWDEREKKGVDKWTGF